MSYQRYDAYGESKLPWLGSIPEHWQLKPFWTLFRRVKRIGFPDEELLSVYRDFGVIRKSNRDDNFNKPSEDLSSYQLVNPGDLAINKMKAWQGSVGASEYRGIVSPAYFVYQPIHKETSKYLHYLMRSPEFTAAYLSLSKGIRVNQWDLDPDYHSRMPILLPPNSEQIAISIFITRETAKIDTLIAEQQKLIELLTEKRKAVISHAVTKGLDPNVKMKDSGIEWIGDVPEHWQLIQIKRIATIKYGLAEPPKYQETGVALIRATNVDAGFIREEGLVFINPEDLPVNRAIWLEAGDIIVVRSGAYTGDSAIIRQEHRPCIAGFDMVLSIKENNSEFVQFSLLSWYLKNRQLEVEMLRAAQPHLNAEELGCSLILLPPRETQSLIVEYLLKVTSEIDLLMVQNIKAINLLRERRSALISAAVTGKIDVRGLVSDTEAA